jgi:2-amino-4-hydroxy-6-hydroxymethyldihydropteridine diphosphokinase
MHNVILSLGSNIHDRWQFLDFGLRSISQNIGKISRISSVYETEPIGFICDGNFYNMCVLVQTKLNPEEILNRLERIESASGRKLKTKNKKYHSRTLDIDIISFDDIKLNSDRLIIPHPNFTERKFVLLPLQEICPNFTDKTTLKTINLILKECQDNSSVLRQNIAVLNNY